MSEGTTKPPRKKHQYTTDVIQAKVAATCMRDKSIFQGKKFDAIAAAIRKEFPNDFVGDKAIINGLEAAGIQVIKGRTARGTHKSKAERAMAAIILRLCEAVEVKANLPSLLSKDDIKMLSAIRSGKIKDLEEEQAEQKPQE